MRYSMILICLFCAGAVQHAQDPASRRPKPPEGAESRPLEPVQDPVRTRVERKDLLQRFKGVNPLEGIYRMKAVHGLTRTVAERGAGYLVIGRDHISIQIHGPGEDPKIPLIQSGFFSYRLKDDRIVMTSLLGHRNKANGDMEIDKVGKQEMRRYVRTGSALRIYKTDTQFMEFIRIE